MTEEEIHAWITFSTVPDMGLRMPYGCWGTSGPPERFSIQA